jgi:hypothetical protein
MEAVSMCIGESVGVVLEEGEPMTTVGAWGVEMGDGEAIWTDGGVSDAPGSSQERASGAGVDGKLRVGGGCSEISGVRVGAGKGAEGRL